MIFLRNHTSKKKKNRFEALDSILILKCIMTNDSIHSLMLKTIE